MLFNSYIFLLGFLPFTAIIFLALRRIQDNRAAKLWLVGASFFFYGWWNPAYLWLLAGSTLFNFECGRRIAAAHKAKAATRARVLLVTGLAVDLGLLAYYKYANFLIDNLNDLAGAEVPLLHIVLPLGISFITFQKIAYLVDSYKGLTRETRLLDFALFVSFFPQLIAGPIVHHKEIIPQFERAEHRRRMWDDIAIGLTILMIGLFKKVVLADSIGLYSTRVFTAADHGATITFIEAWMGALSYTLQIYFDFSGYSDMAIGAARIFGIRMPLNFHSPYKATTIIEFWRRWHMTLSRFLRDYLYIALGGNRKGPLRRHGNLLATMVLGGLWHGASWNFVLWGALHGFYLLINHAWRGTGRRLPPALGWALCFLAVMVAWVPFRAETLGGAAEILRGLAGLNGVVLPVHYARWAGMLPGVTFADVPLFGGMAEAAVVAAILTAALILPNTQQWMGRYHPAIAAEERLAVMPPRWRRLAWRPHAAWGLALIGLTLLSLWRMTGVSEFLYFQF